MLRSKVLLPSDGSDNSLKAAGYAARLMKTNSDMKVSVLVVVPESSGFKKIDQAMEDKGSEIMNKTVSFFSDDGLNVEKFIEKGDPATVIIQYAERDSYDHIIMGSRGVSELRGASIGSVSHKVIHLANCRVTLVK